jgi:hypothetical protein
MDRRGLLAAGAAAAAGALVSPRGMTPFDQDLRGGTLNLLCGRDPDRVAAWVDTWATTRRLDFLALQETGRYCRHLEALEGWQLIAPAWPDRRWPETAVLVRDGIAAGPGYLVATRATWHTPDGIPRGPRRFTTVQVAGWIRVTSVHYPAGVRFLNGHATGGRDRVTAYLTCSARLEDHCHRWPGPLALVGDWNAPRAASGPGSPRWLATRNHLQGHGARIDYPLIRGCVLGGVRVWHDTGGSDHPAVTFTVTR